jgi:hypothetical protein
VDLVEQPGVQALLDRLGAVHSHGLRGGSRFRSRNGALDAVGDELDCRAGPWPAVGDVVGNDESGHIEWVLAAPSVGALEKYQSKTSSTPSFASATYPSRDIDMIATTLVMVQLLSRP